MVIDVPIGLTQATDHLVAVNVNSVAIDDIDDGETLSRQNASSSV